MSCAAAGRGRPLRTGILLGPTVQPGPIGQLDHGLAFEQDSGVGDDARTCGAGTEQPSSLGLAGHRAAGSQDPNGLAPRDEHAATLGRQDRPRCPISLRRRGRRTRA